jgi:TonB family protein
MSHNWKQWVGQVVNSKFPLLRDLGSSEHSVVFLTERQEGESLLRAAIKLIPAVPENNELQLSRWRLATGLSHPHLIQLFEMGSCELGNAPFLYIVMECAEENLAQVLPDRALTPAETREMLEPVLDVLAYLHGKGFVHGHITPTNIMANGDQLKVSSDGLRRAGESSNRPSVLDKYDPPETSRGFIPVTEAMSPAADIWSLGMTLVEALTQHLPAKPAGEGDPLLPQALPEPFLDIARHCLLRNPQSRWTVAKIAARLENRTPMTQGRTPVHPTQSASRPQGSPTKRHRYAVALGVGVVLLTILAGSRLFQRHSEAPQVSAGALKEPTIRPTRKQEEQAPQAPPTTVSRPNAAEERLDSRGATSVPASAALDTPSEEEVKAGAQPPADALVHGEVIQQVLPEVPQSARDSIQGRVRVTVRVDVDESGSVEDAELETSGPSKYFARLALEAAQRWRFKPPKTAERNVLSTWTLRFQFRRAETTVVPTQEIP